MPSSKAELSTKDNAVRSLQQELEQIQAGVSTMATSTAVPSERDPEANEALSTHSSELRVALKAASAFVQEVKDVFSSVAAMKPTGKAAKSVLEVQDAFEENGGMDPVTSLEVAFDKWNRLRDNCDACRKVVDPTSIPPTSNDHRRET